MKYSLLIGCCAVILLLRPVTAGNGLADPPAVSRVLGSANGRYVFGQISDFRADKYMLDTQTGRLWTIETTDTNESGEQLFPVPYDSLDEKGKLIKSLTP
jgi:hypothetical protein